MTESGIGVSEQGETERQNIHRFDTLAEQFGA